jgi:hypothetical protein
LQLRREPESVAAAGQRLVGLVLFEELRDVRDGLRTVEDAWFRDGRPPIGDLDLLGEERDAVVVEHELVRVSTKEVGDQYFFFSKSSRIPSDEGMHAPQVKRPRMALHDDLRAYDEERPPSHCALRGRASPPSARPGEECLTST